MRAIFRTRMRAEAANIDDGSCARLAQRRQAGFYTEERAVERNVENFAPRRIAHLGERLLAPQRCVVDEDIETAELLDGRIRHGLHRHGVGDVPDMNQRLAAGRFYLAHDRVRLGAVAACVHHDRGTSLRERQRDRPADIAARASDDGDLAGEFLGHEPLSTQ